MNDSLLRPSKHFNSEGKNILTEIKHEYNESNVFLILSNYYLLVEGNTLFGQLTEAEIEAYYGLTYLNRIFVVKSDSGEELPYYWVI
ncbi:MAG: hypothetical protein ACFFKA_17780 [Candidatus Thorarchaeota archaeon]